MKLQNLLEKIENNDLDKIWYNKIEAILDYIRELNELSEDIESIKEIDHDLKLYNHFLLNSKKLANKILEKAN